MILTDTVFTFHWLDVYKEICLCFTEIGVGLAGFGISFLFLGIILFFDRGLLAIGNVSITVSIVKFYTDMHLTLRSLSLP